MSTMVAQSQFTELVSEYDELMCIEPVPSEQVPLRLTPDREQRILDLTSRYIRELESIQQSHDSAAAAFAERLRNRDDIPDCEFLEPICQRFLAGAGLTLRGEIPRSVSRSEKRKARRLIIRWADDDPVAIWDGIDVKFPLRDSLVFCAEHSAGADAELCEHLADQLMSDLRDGINIIRRLSLESHDDTQSIFRWETALASSDGAGAAPVETESETAEDESPIVSYLEDCARSFDCGTHELQEVVNDSCQNIHEQVACIVAQNGGQCDVSIQQRVEQFVQRAMQSCNSNEKLFAAMSSAAYSGIAAAILNQNEPVMHQRVGVFQSVNHLKAQVFNDSSPA